MYPRTIWFFLSNLLNFLSVKIEHTCYLIENLVKYSLKLPLFLAAILQNGSVFIYHRKVRETYTSTRTEAN